MTTDSHAPTPALQCIAVEALQIGMFVTGIATQRAQMVISRPGCINSMEQLAALRARGVQEVWVDPARARSGEPVTAQSLTEMSTATSASSGHARDPGSAARKASRIHRLYKEAKTMQNKLFRSLKRGEPLQVADLEAIADELVDSIFENRDALFCLARIREKDSYLMEHSLNVAMLLANFGRYLGLDRSILRELTIGGLLHDTGKIMIPDAILHKPARLTDEEFAVMRSHVQHSIDILKDAAGITPVMMTVAACHHERLDGKGYPFGLSGERLNLYARMSTIVDVYDALTADRCYKAGMPPTAAFRILLQGAGSQFDDDLVSRFIKCMGIHPVGTLVKLKSGKLAVVIERNEDAPLQPVVKVFYSTVGQHHLDVRILDLGKASDSEQIETAVDPKQYGVEIARYLM